MKTQLFALAFLTIFLGACDGDFAATDDAGSDALKADVRAGDALARDGRTSTVTSTVTGTESITCEIPCPLADPQCGPYGRRPIASKYLKAEGETFKCPDLAQTDRPVCTDPVGGFTGATGQYTTPGYACCVQTVVTATGSRKVVGLNCSLCTKVVNPDGVSLSAVCPWRSGGYGNAAVCLLNAGTQSVKFIGWDCLI
jgi:hypothetical protein